MTHTRDIRSSGAAASGLPAALAARVRRWSAAVVAANVVFVAAWLVAGSWQGPRYSLLADSISDMYANGAPNAAFLIVVITLCGAVVLLFAWLALWPSLRRAGRPAAVGAALLAVSILGLGDLLTPFERGACTLARTGCTSSAQLANVGGLFDAVLSTAGVVALVGAGGFLAAAMASLPEWRGWVRPTRQATGVILVLLAADGLSGSAGLSGLFERMLALAAAASVAALGVGVWRHTRPAATAPQAPAGAPHRPSPSQPRGR
ncbi:MAG TPA: hypothetical protein VGS19_14145 [Streptosporangiaceae bacterium]|nr:hypothetical protein [Streptosporangiaceae bacterium]